MARDVSKEGLEVMLIQAMSAGKSVRAQLDRLLQLRRRLQQRDGDGGAAVVQEVAAGLFNVYYRGLEYASRYLISFFNIAMESGACLDLLDFAFAVIPDEQLYGVLLAQARRLPARPATQAEAFARVEAALHAVKLPEEHHIPRCIELLVGVRPPNVTGKPLPFGGMAGYWDDPVAAAHEHFAKNGFPSLNPNPAEDASGSGSGSATAAAAAAAAANPPQAATSIDLDQALSYLHRACSLASLAVKHIDVAVAALSSFFDPEKVAEISETADSFTYIPEE